MGGRKTTLDDYADGEPPADFDNPPMVNLDRYYTTEFRVPTDRSKLAGWTGIDRERGRVYISVRKLNKHYFRKYDAYAFSTRVLARAQNENVDYVVVWEVKNGRTHVWPLTDLLSNEEISYNGDAQKIAPLDEAIGTWEQNYRPIVEQR